MQRPSSGRIEPQAGPAPGPQFSSHFSQGVHVITLARSEMLDAPSIERLGDEIYHHVKTIEAPRLVIDLGNVRQMSSAALGMLIALKKVTDRQGGRICLANVRDELVEVFKITKLNRVLKIHPSTDKAVGSLA